MDKDKEKVYQAWLVSKGGITVVNAYLSTMRTIERHLGSLDALMELDIEEACTQLKDIPLKKSSIRQMQSRLRKYHKYHEIERG